jgi:hypothetical protein
MALPAHKLQLWQPGTGHSIDELLPGLQHIAATLPPAPSHAPPPPA